MTMPAPRRAIVIGSGFGGLALAIRLQAAGVATTILEQRDKPGGRAYVFEDQGFTFDAGPTVITAPGCLEDLFTLAGERPSGRMRRLGGNWAHGLPYRSLAEELRHIESVTTADAKRVARRFPLIPWVTGRTRPVSA
jgi:phytoene dehydrogenase-like protein